MGGCGNINCDHCSEPPKEKCNALIQATVAGNIICSNDKPCFFHLAELPKRAVYEDRSQDPPKEEWEEEFELKFGVGSGYEFGWSKQDMRAFGDIKQFISEKITQAEERTYDAGQIRWKEMGRRGALLEVIKKIEDLKYRSEYFKNIQDDVLSILREELK